MIALTSLELAVSEAIARQFPEAAEAISAQLASASVTAREFTPTGFFTEFDVDRATPPAPTMIGPVGYISSLVGPNRYPMEFMLYVWDGYAEMIEAYSYGDGYRELDLLSAEFSDPQEVSVPPL
ncbi:hypothetical protein D3C85_1210560 [compost metagenome]